MAEKGSSKGGIVGTVIGTLAAIAGGFAFGSFGIKGGSTVADAAGPPRESACGKASRG